MCANPAGPWSGRGHRNRLSGYASTPRTLRDAPSCGKRLSGHAVHGGRRRAVTNRSAVSKWGTARKAPVRGAPDRARRTPSEAPGRITQIGASVVVSAVRPGRFTALCPKSGRYLLSSLVVLMTTLGWETSRWDEADRLSRRGTLECRRHHVVGGSTLGPVDRSYGVCRWALPLPITARPSTGSHQAGHQGRAAGRGCGSRGGPPTGRGGGWIPPIPRAQAVEDPIRLPRTALPTHPVGRALGTRPRMTSPGVGCAVRQEGRTARGQVTSLISHPCPPTGRRPRPRSRGRVSERRMARSCGSPPR